jgi:RNA-directed DNA polymerase
MENTKSFDIPKRLVWEAWKRIKANKGTYGVDSVSIEEFEADIANNLYKIWNRMSSGAYFPPPVRRVEIPKGDGKTRPLGIPTVGDRVAQMVVKMELEPGVDSIFHPDSYGYRPGRSAIEAVRTARERCWRYDWTVDLDIKGFFDNIDHELLLKAVKMHANNAWTRLYIDRWLKAPVVMVDGSLEARVKGTPQGGVISPLLANLYLHYALDVWMSRNHPEVPFERYADDIVFHCKTKWKAKNLLGSLNHRLADCKLELHPEKTKIVYCKDSKRRGDYEVIAFDFLGFTFRPREAMSRKQQLFTGFTPAISRKSLNRISKTIRSWKLQRWSDQSIDDIAQALNPVISGWLAYYQHFGKSLLYKVTDILNFALIRWIRRKYKGMSRSYRKSKQFLG